MLAPPDSLRSSFPGAEGRVYLNACSVGLPPREARETHLRWADAMERFEDATFGDLYAEQLAFCDALAELINAPTGSVWVDQNASALLGRLMSAFDPRARRNRIVTTDLEFPSAEVIFRAFAAHGGELVVVPSRDGLSIDAERVAEAIDDRTLLAFASCSTTVTGARLDVAPLRAACERHGALLGLDVYQSVGAYPFDAAATGADFLVGGGHKWLLGAWDLGWIQVRSALLGSLVPVASGWIAGADPYTFDRQTALAPDARRLAAGAPAPLPAMLTRLGLERLKTLGMAVVRAHLVALGDLVIENADARGLSVLTPRDARGSHLALGFPELAEGGVEQVCAALRTRGVVTSHRRAGERRALRVAPHVYNDTSDVDRLFEAIDEALAELRS
ncbi:MAG: aminotransferase class V-fold PLP-dependent enzyme [Myxococcales bacterium]|nr:aminotransferase class V-fold PLP-dependent enzyme [Myxococcales bacterium]